MHVHHEIAGTGPAILLTHGFRSSSHMYAATVADLSADHTTVAWDIRGHGKSGSLTDPAEYSVAASLADMVALIDAAGAERATLVGHSLGGYLSLDLTLAHPDRIEALVLVDSGPGFRNDEARAKWNAMAERYAADLEEGGLNGLPSDAEVDPAVHTSAHALALAALGILRQGDGHVLEALPSIAVPTLIVVGERDEPFLGASQYMDNKIPGARLVTIAGAGHAPPVTHPAEFNAAVREFLGFGRSSMNPREEVRAWIAAHWDPDLPLREWRRLLLDSGWAAPSWPTDWFGRGLPRSADAVVAEELAAAGAVGPPLGAGIGLAAPTLLAHASADLMQALLPPTVTGEATWCQLFSEPGSGSDLAGLTTRADDDGDEWVVNGQKVWSTSAHHADYGMLLARTDWDVPKHHGITYFVLPMKQPGVEARPLRQMNGHASFNEVFLTDARVPAANVVGAPGDGWRVALTTLAHERGFATVRRRRFDPAGGWALREASAEADEYFATYSWYPQRAGRPDLVADVAAATGRRDDPVARQRLAALVARQRAHDWTARRAQAARSTDRSPGPEGSLGKLAASDVARDAAATHSLLAGAAGTLSGDDGLLDGVVAEVLTSVPGQSIAGGTDEIQRNIIGERVLGLPKEPAVDRDVPFREVPRNAGRAAT